MKMDKRFLLSVLVSAVIIVFLFIRVLDFEGFVKALASVNVVLFFASDIPYLIQAMLMGYRLSWAMRRIDVQVRWSEGFFAHLFGMLGSDFSIGRTAYISASLPFKSSLAGGVGVLSALVVVDLIVKAGLGIISALVFFYSFGFNVNPRLILLSLAVIFAGGIFFSVTLNPKTVSFVTKIPYLGKIVVPYYIQFKRALESLKGKLMFLAVFAIVGWLLRGVEWLILGTACGLPLSFWTYLMLHPLLTLVRLLPVTIAGLGVFELTLIALFPAVNASQLAAFGILDMINNAFVDIFGLKAVRSMRK